jgi:signal transduction histidine kinase
MAIGALAAVGATSAVGDAALDGGLDVAGVIGTGLGLLLVVAGQLLEARHRGPASGRLVSLAGLAWVWSVALTGASNQVVFTLGLMLFPLGLAALGHLALVFPGARATTASERRLVLVLYGLAVAGLPVIETTGCSDCPGNLIGVDIDRGTGRLYYVALILAAMAATVTVLAILLRRWSQSSPAARRVLLPILPGACLVAAAYVGGLMAELGLPSGLGQLWAQITLALLALAPLAVLAGLLRSRLARGKVGRLVVELGDAPSVSVRDPLARALGDPTVEVAYWLPDRGVYVDGDGRPVELPTADSRRATTVVERAGSVVGAIVYDAALADDPSLVETAAAAVGLALENERLHAEVLARLEEVRASRARIVEAADAARRRVERDLHDGAQQRLVNLSLLVGMAQARVPAEAPAVEGLLRQAGGEAALALQELRELAQGLHPAALTELGLEAAVETLAERSPVPVEVTASTNGRPPAPVEAAAYFVVSEALANAAKHAGATVVSVRISHDGDRLRVEVADDGVGGAEVRPGSGLEGLADRVAALDGRLSLRSEPGAGTRVEVDLPCG